MSELFWQDIDKAVQQVSTHNDREVTVERAGWKATIVAAAGAILISLEEVDQEPPTLVVP